MTILNQLNKKSLKFLYDTLVYMQPKYDKVSYGICVELRSSLGSLVNYGYPATTIFEAAKGLMQEWPNYSGDPAYPISDKNSLLSPGEQYAEARRELKVWDSSTEYGRLRHELLLFMILSVAEQLKKTKE